MVQGVPLVTMDKGVAENMLARACTAGFDLPGEVSLLPGPLLLTRVAKHVQSGKTDPHKPTRSRFPSHEEVDARDADTMDERSKTPFKGVTDISSLSAAMTLKLEAVAVCTVGILVPPGVETDPKGGGFVLTAGMHKRMLQHLAATATRMRGDAAGFYTHWRINQDLLADHTRTMDFNLAYAKVRLPSGLFLACVSHAASFVILLALACTYRLPRCSASVQVLAHSATALETRRAVVLEREAVSMFTKGTAPAPAAAQSQAVASPSGQKSKSAMKRERKAAGRGGGTSPPGPTPPKQGKQPKPPPTPPPTAPAGYPPYGYYPPPPYYPSATAVPPPTPPPGAPPGRVHYQQMVGGNPANPQKCKDFAKPRKPGEIDECAKIRRECMFSHS